MDLLLLQVNLSTLILFAGILPLISIINCKRVYDSPNMTIDKAILKAHFSTIEYPRYPRSSPSMEERPGGNQNNNHHHHNNNNNHRHPHSLQQQQQQQQQQNQQMQNYFEHLQRNYYDTSQDGRQGDIYTPGSASYSQFQGLFKPSQRIMPTTAPPTKASSTTTTAAGTSRTSILKSIGSYTSSKSISSSSSSSVKSNPNHNLFPAEPLSQEQLSFDKYAPSASSSLPNKRYYLPPHPSESSSSSNKGLEDVGRKSNIKENEVQTTFPPSKSVTGVSENHTERSKGDDNNNNNNVSENNDREEASNDGKMKQEIRFIIHKAGDEEMIKKGILQASPEEEIVKFIKGPNFNVQKKQKVHLKKRKLVIYIMLREPEITNQVELVRQDSEGSDPKPEVFVIYQSLNKGVRSNHIKLR